MKKERMITMKAKKTFLGVISGAVAGSVMSAAITVGTMSYMSDKKSAVTDSAVSGASQQSVQLLAEGSEKTELSTEEIAKRVGPSIVGISCTTQTQSYFGVQTGTSSGSGIIISADGNIMTNYHVISGGTNIKVKLNTGNEYDATVIGGDEKTDVAVIKIKANEELHVATLGNSDEVEVGSKAVAIGNPLASELFGTVTQGVISGVNRTITVGQREMNLIQTDAAISPGNSGGALINKYGEVIGINSVKLVSDNAEGLGFAIPINEASTIVKDLIDYGYVKGRPVIGVSVREITKELAYYNNLLTDHGLYIMSVSEGSSAEKAGLVRGDIIVKFDGKTVNSSTEMNKLRDKHKAGDTVSITFMRGTQEKTVNLTLSEDTSSKKN